MDKSARRMGQFRFMRIMKYMIAMKKAALPDF